MLQSLFFLKISVAIPADLWYMFVLQGGEHMNKLLKDLYDCFYTPPELAATKREIEECHRALIEALGKPCLLYTSPSPRDA